MDHSITASASAVGAHPHASVRWGAILAGWLVASGVASLMYTAGLALGFTAFDPHNAGAVARGYGIGTVAWIVLTWAASLFLGGMFASWFDGRADQTVGALHGVVVWGLAVAATGLLVALGITHVLQGGAALVRGAVAAETTAPGMGVRGETSSVDDAAVGLQAQLTQRVAQASARNAPTATLSVPAPGGQASANSLGTTAASEGTQASAADIRRATEQLDRRTMALVVSALLRGDTENAKALLAANTSLSQSEIDQTLQGLSAQIEKSKADMQAAADKAARYAATAMWIIFLSSLIALVAAAVGGWLGAGHIHRVYHLRRYETVSSPPL